VGRSPTPVDDGLPLKTTAKLTATLAPLPVAGRREIRVQCYDRLVFVDGRFALLLVDPCPALDLINTVTQCRSLPKSRERAFSRINALTKNQFGSFMAKTI